MDLILGERLANKRIFTGMGFAVGGLGLVLLCSCATPKSQLEKVAKDWCLTIRASQVIPVYPLSEDIQPGDIYLVTTPVPKQVELWKSKGFLPLDQLIARLRLKGYNEFYQDSYGINKASNIPHNWQFPKGNATPITDANTTGWALAPRVAFPSYSFKVEKGGGINMALPIQGVPVALSALGAQSATASVVIKNAYTYALDEMSLAVQMETWAEENAHRSYLARYQPTGTSAKKNYYYLRIISRVYLAKEFNISVTSDDAFKGEASGGAPKPVENLVLKPYRPDTTISKTATGKTEVKAPAVEAEASLSEKSAEKETVPPSGAEADTSTPAAKAMSQLDSAQGILPGGTIRVNSASSRSVSLTETLDRPVVIGYLAMEYRIEEGGVIGTPVSTLSILEGQSQFRVFENYKVSNSTERLDDYEAKNSSVVRAWMKKQPSLKNVDVVEFLTFPEYEGLRQKAIIELRIQK